MPLFFILTENSGFDTNRDETDRMAFISIFKFLSFSLFFLPLVYFGPLSKKGASHWGSFLGLSTYCIVCILLEKSLLVGNAQI